MNFALCQANELYRVGVAGSQGMSRSSQRSCLERAISIYSSELDSTHRPTDVVSLQKNLGMAHFRLGQVIKPSNKEINLIVYHLNEALRYWVQAWLGQGPQLKNGEWGQRLQGSVASLFETAFKSCKMSSSTCIFYEF